MKWIKHDSDANQDAKLQNVLLDYGLEGYGLYWYCIELISGKVDKENITFVLEHDARIISRNVGSTVQKVEEMMRYFVEIGLFEGSGGVITCLKLARRLDKSMTSNPEMREIIGSFKTESHDSIMTESRTIMQDKIRLDKIRLDKIRLDKNKENTVDQQVDLEDLISTNEKATASPSKVMKAFNEILGDKLSKIRSMTPNRIKHLKARISEYKTVKPFYDIEEWEKFFTYLRNQCPFFIGETPGQVSGENSFLPDFDWLIKPSNFAKCIEGKYESR